MPLPTVPSALYLKQFPLDNTMRNDKVHVVPNDVESWRNRDNNDNNDNNNNAPARTTPQIMATSSAFPAASMMPFGSRLGVVRDYKDAFGSKHKKLKPPPGSSTRTSAATTREEIDATSTLRSTTSLGTTTTGGDLQMKLVGDVVVASGVTFCISPFTSIIDKAIVEQAAGKHAIGSSLAMSLSTMLRSPTTFLKSPTFLLMWGVYAATYTTANCLKTGMEYQESQNVRNNEEASTSATTHRKKTRTNKDNDKHAHAAQPVKIDKFNVFLSTTFVNSGLSIMRDKIYAQVRTSKQYCRLQHRPAGWTNQPFDLFRCNAITDTHSHTHAYVYFLPLVAHIYIVILPIQMFGNSANGAAPSKMPFKTYGLWGLRDGVVIASSFVLPDIVGASLHERGFGTQKADAVKLAQIACPIASQFVAGPAQLLGLDYYNRPHASLGERGALLLKNFSTVVAARIARILPTYGVGGIGNTHFRNQWRDYLIRRNVTHTMIKSKGHQTREQAQRRGAASLVVS
jgi:hypothetical protein